MNCHGDNKGNKSNHNHSPLKHMLHMVICCGLPIVLLAVLPMVSRLSPGASIAISKIVPFICPLMMFAMIPMMMGGNKKRSCCDDKNNTHINNNGMSDLNKSAE